MLILDLYDKKTKRYFSKVFYDRESCRKFILRVKHGKKLIIMGLIGDNYAMEGLL